MNKKRFLNFLLFKLIFICANANASSIATMNNNKDVQQSLSELQSSYQSAQKINIIFTHCQMKYECIIKALQDLVDKEHDPLAKEFLNKFTKQGSQSFEVFNKCFEFERNEVNNALSFCMAQSHEPPLLNQGQCSEKALLTLVDAGNTVAQMALLKYYEIQGDAGKFKLLQEKLTQLGPILSDKTKKRCEKYEK